ncbi:helix-turn-helix domain-containing protein [Gordonia hongkongensis]|uniref:helix-turn-helix domain-containing protein n=1 Tax=Gordonia hongkongensis TaxID=1701090 RepID=UPI001FF7CFE8|nr:XRE family transcriptional regulator [Gordonia hongkongensis]UPG70837.1 XRE family transcriptional regulator [Gordonia hongkongensis]
MSEDKRATFRRGNERIAELLADPDTAARVETIRGEMAQADRAHAMGLAAIRRAAQLTQTELAQRMGIKQAAVSGLEARDDLLLSTLANYLAAAGATDVTITARLGDRTVEVALPAQLADGA